MTHDELWCCCLRRFSLSLCPDHAKLTLLPYFSPASINQRFCYFLLPPTRLTSNTPQHFTTDLENEENVDTNGKHLTTWHHLPQYSFQTNVYVHWILPQTPQPLHDHNVLRGWSRVPLTNPSGNLAPQMDCCPRVNFVSEVQTTACVVSVSRQKKKETMVWQDFSKFWRTI